MSVEEGRRVLMEAQTLHFYNRLNLYKMKGEHALGRPTSPAGFPGSLRTARGANEDKSGVLPSWYGNTLCF